jgi:hypothetical protein
VSTRHVFGEDIPLEPELPALLVDVGDRLEQLRLRFAEVSLPEERFDLLNAALDELEGALDGVRDAHAALARIERRLADGYQIVLRRLRDVERELESPK